MNDPAVIPVYAALTRIIAELPAIGKDSRGPKDQGSYAYRGIETITGHVQPLLAKHGVVVVPSARVVSQAPSPGMKETWQDVTLEVEWTIVGPDGSTMTARTVGIGRDSGDKQCNKAMSQAYKYLWLDLLCIADSKDDSDGADYSADVAPPPPAPPKTAGMLVFDRLAGQSPETQAALRARKADFTDAKLTAASFDANDEWLDAAVYILDNATKGDQP